MVSSYTRTFVQVGPKELRPLPDRKSRDRKEFQRPSIPQEERGNRPKVPPQTQLSPSASRPRGARRLITTTSTGERGGDRLQTCTPLQPSNEYPAKNRGKRKPETCAVKRHMPLHPRAPKRQHCRNRPVSPVITNRWV